MSSDREIAIRVEGLGKQYLIPQRHEEETAAEPTVREQLKEFFPGLLGADENDYFWALKDVSFTVKRGEVFGIVGQNGSGKSTLLKILSSVTLPTEGSVELHGRVGSLLEVGTGFHPDLTGRQNIYFNGALLGVPQKDIRQKIDSIIDFSGIGRFIDVPVKRYSSGMYIRLAYSVASLLESDILILDEVLAVGDASFRAKTEGHIREASSTGKTVLLVSHNPQTVITTCDRALVLNHGRVAFLGDSKDVIAEYLSGHYAVEGDLEETEEGQSPDSGADAADDESSNATDADNDDNDLSVVEAAQQKRFRRRVRPKSYVQVGHLPRMRYPGLPAPTEVTKWVSVHNMDGDRQAVFNTGDGVRFRIGFEGLKDPSRAYFSVLIHNSRQERMVTADSTHVGPLKPGSKGVVECTIPRLMLGDGLYSVMIDSGIFDFETGFFQTQDCVSHATYIRVNTNGYFKGVLFDEFQGCAHPTLWSVLRRD